MTACRCLFCSRPLEPAQELRFLVETETLDNPAYLNRIRQLPASDSGRPLRVCKGCQGHLERDPHRFRAVVEQARARRQVRTGMLAAVGILSVGWFLSKLLGTPQV